MIKEDGDDEDAKGARETTGSKGGILKSSHDKSPTEAEVAVTFDDEERKSDLPKVTKMPTVKIVDNYVEDKGVSMTFTF